MRNSLYTFRMFTKNCASRTDASIGLVFSEISLPRGSMFTLIDLSSPVKGHGAMLLHLCTFIGVAITVDWFSTYHVCKSL